MSVVISGIVPGRKTVVVLSTEVVPIVIYKPFHNNDVQLPDEDSNLEPSG